MPYEIDPERVVVTEPVPGSEYPVHLMYVELLDGVYAPIGLRTPAVPGPYPTVLLGRGNGGGGMAWVREATRNMGCMQERLLAAGYACAWLRYRAEVELGYNNGGRLVEDIRQGRQLLNRSPLEYEDEIAIIEYMKTLPEVDGERIGLMGVSHAGEMILKITSEYGGARTCVACEPASHEFLDLAPDDTAFVNEETQLRNIEGMMMREVEKVRARINEERALERMKSIRTPILIMGRQKDHLQGVFRATYDLMVEAGGDVEWTSYDHPLHGYIFPERGEGGEYAVDETQEAAIAECIAYLDKHMKN